MTEAELQSTPEQQEMPFAVVQGVPFTRLPKDLYIPPDALEVFLAEAFEGAVTLLPNAKQADPARPAARTSASEAWRVIDMISALLEPSFSLRGPGQHPGLGTRDSGLL